MRSSLHERDAPRQIEWVMGAFFLIKREVFEKTHGFDEKIFMYMEEVEWCMRIKALGYKVFYTPSFSLIHVGGASSGGDISVPLFREMEGLLYVYKKHYPSLVWYLKLIIMLGCLMRIIAFTLLGKTNRVNAYLSVLKNVK
jgi:GT2 family glycosyltransferase